MMADSYNSLFILEKYDSKNEFKMGLYKIIREQRQMKGLSPFTPAFQAVHTADPNTLNVAYESLIELLTSKSKEFEQLPHSQVEGQLRKLYTLKISKLDTYFLKFLEKLIRLAYSSKSRLRQSIYEIIPDLMIFLQRFLSTDQEQETAYLKGIDNIILAIYNNQCHLWKKYHESLHLKVDEYLHQLVKTSEKVFLGNSDEKDFKQMDRLDFSNKSTIKTFMIFLYYYHLGGRSEHSIVSFFKLVFVYCGGTPPKQGFELYLLNKSNDKTLFKHRVSEQQMEWILLVLYYVYVNYKHLKFQVISAVTVIRKKSANESKFRIYEIAQSILHLFQNQYEDVF